MLYWEAVRTRIGKPWMDSGRDTPGVDCFGLIIQSGRDIGIDMDPRNEYSRRTPPSKMANQILQFTQLIRPQGRAMIDGPIDRKELREDRIQYTVTDLLPSDILVYQRPAQDVHLGVVTPGDLKSPLYVVYTAFRDQVKEVPIQVTGLQYRWVFRLPNQS